MNSTGGFKYIKVKVFPKSGRYCVEGLRNGLLVIRLKSTPENGQANKELRKVLSRYYLVSPSDISVIRGHTSRIKLVKIGSGTTDQPNPSPAKR